MLANLARCREVTDALRVHDRDEVACRPGRVSGLRRCFMQDGVTYQITLVHLNGRANFRLVGEFDLAAVPALRDEVSRLAGCLPVFVEMDDVTLVDSSALQVFLEAAKVAAEQGTTFRLVNVPETVRRTLEVSGTVELLTEHGARGWPESF
jgi:anti-anti-sigma factor